MTMEIAGTGGPRRWGVTVDDEGYRTYELVFRLKGAVGDGPAAALQCPGLPAVGSAWFVGNDVDIWAFRKWATTATMVEEDGPNRYWDTKLIFSTKSNEKKCNDQKIEDPLLEPQKISGKFVKDKERGGFASSVEYYTNGALVRTVPYPARILNSAFEEMHGPQNEWDVSRWAVHVEQNVLSLQLELCDEMRDAVNDAALWGFPARCVKLCDFTWEKLYYGQCYAYYKRMFDFEINAIKHPTTGVVTSGWDKRELLDEGMKVIRGEWNAAGTLWIPDVTNPPNYLNPSHYIRFKDPHGNLARVVLDGAGDPHNSDTHAEPGKVKVKKYFAKNLLLLGIPTIVG